MSEKFDFKSTSATKDATIDKILGNIPSGLAAIGKPVAEDDFAAQAETLKVEQLAKTESLLALEARQAELERNLEELRKGSLGVKATSEVRPSPKPIDWTKVTEQDAYEFSIPIEAVSYDIPAYMDVELADKNFIPRWVNVNPARMGPMKVVGFIPVEEKDLARPLALEIGKDGNGHYKYIDVILMKVPKNRYFAAIKSNFLRSIMLTDQKRLHEINQAKMGQYMMEAGDVLNEETGKYHNVPKEYQYAQQKGANGRPKLEVYI